MEKKTILSVFEIKNWYIKNETTIKNIRYITTFKDLKGSIEIKELIKSRAQKDAKQKIRILLFNISNTF